MKFKQFVLFSLGIFFLLYLSNTYSAFESGQDEERHEPVVGQAGDPVETAFEPNQDRRYLINVGATQRTSSNVIYYVVLGYSAVVETIAGQRIGVAYVPNDDHTIGTVVYQSIMLSEINAAIPDVDLNDLEEDYQIRFFATIEVFAPNGTSLGVFDTTDAEQAHDLLTRWAWGPNSIGDLNSRINRIADEEVIIEEPLTESDVQNQAVEILAATPDAVIASNKRHEEVFDVLRGIPSGEQVYVHVTTDAYKLSYLLQRHTGTRNLEITLNANVTYEYLEQARDASGALLTDSLGAPIMEMQSQTAPYSRVYNRVKPYTYYSIALFSIHALDRVTVQNEGVGTVELPLTAYENPNVNLQRYESEQERFSYTSTINAGNITVNQSPSDLLLLSSLVTDDLMVRNDRLIIDDTTLLNDAWALGVGVAPVDSHTLPKTQDGLLYQDGINLPKLLANGIYNSDTEVRYRLMPESLTNSPEFIYENIDTNGILVHTPVVCVADVNHQEDLDQSLVMDANRKTMVLGTETQVTLLTTGQHMDLPGYGNRDYADYATRKQVRFPFNVYMNTTYAESGKYLAAGVWCTLPLQVETFDIFIPTWVQEGDYTVDFRTLAHNTVDNDSAQRFANLNRTHTIAHDQVEVTVKGRLYGFKITDVTDYPRWETVFRTQLKGVVHTGQYYHSGEYPVGQSNTVEMPWLLPLGPGGHPDLPREMGLRTGYGFKFQVDTIGDYIGIQDAISIRPRFTYYGRDGSVVPVDIYYHGFFDGKSQQFIKIDANVNRKNTLWMKLGDPYRNIDRPVLEASAQLHDYKLGEWLNQEVRLGWLDWLVLSQELRTYIGTLQNRPAQVASDLVRASVQRWYGDYYLPNTVFVAPLGTQVGSASGLKGNESFWLKDGYVAVSFDMVTVKNGTFSQPVLSYANGQSSMWTIEGFNGLRQSFDGIDFNFAQGTVVVYDLSKKASDDYKSGGTH